MSDKLTASEIAAKISRLCDCGCDGYLKNGRYYFEAKRNYPIRLSVEITNWTNEETPIVLPPASIFPIRIKFDVEYHTMQNDIETIAERLDAEFAKLYRDSIGTNNNKNG